MYEGMGGMEGFSLEDLADEEQTAQGQAPINNDAANQVSAATSTPTAPPPAPNQVPLATQQWQQWDQQRRAGNIQPIPAPVPAAAPVFPWSKVLVGAGIAAAVVAEVARRV